jgi:hypothetical protein
MAEVSAPDPSSDLSEWIVTGVGDMPLPGSERAWRALPEALRMQIRGVLPSREQPESDRMQKELAEVKE